MATVVHSAQHVAGLRTGETQTFSFALNIREPMQQLVVNVDARWIDDLVGAGNAFGSAVR
jgi:hypothetical protein